MMNDNNYEDYVTVIGSSGDGKCADNTINFFVI